MSAGVQAKRPNGSVAACFTRADCAEGEICTEAGTCQEARRELISANAPDTDGDGVADPFDNCPRRANAAQADNDGDEVGDECDLCDLTDPDSDLDGLPDCADVSGQHLESRGRPAECPKPGVDRLSGLGDGRCAGLCHGGS